MDHLKQIGPQLFYSFPLQEEEKIKLVNFLEILETSGVWEYMPESRELDQSDEKV